MSEINCKHKTASNSKSSSDKNLTNSCTHKHSKDNESSTFLKSDFIKNWSSILNKKKFSDCDSNEISNETTKFVKNIEKHIIHGSRQLIPSECEAPGGGLAYPKESKFIFHYQIRKLDSEQTILDDTRKYGKTMELYSGKEFQIDFWEQCLGTMLPGEVASFIVPVERLQSFPAVNKKLRDYMLNKKDETIKHCCGLMSLQDQGGLGYPDLDELMMKPESLEFIFELIKVEIPGSVRKETWIMTPEEKAAIVPVLREEGNRFYSHGDYEQAAGRYSEALGLLEQLVLREKPGDPEWVELDKSRVPLFVNLAQCQFKSKDYYAVIHNTTEALNRDPTNVKALFRRSKAYTETWDLDLAANDLKKVAELLPDMVNAVNTELKLLEQKRSEQELKERRRLAGKLFAYSKI